MYLDSQGLVQVKKDNKIYFKKYEEDVTSIIVYNKESEVCMLSEKVINQISDFFSMDKSDSKVVISKWVEKTLEVEVSHIKPLSAAQKRVGGIWS
jgi:DNA polymerase III sliding clamp (beta) subunit (PCNA family)